MFDILQLPMNRGRCNISQVVEKLQFVSFDLTYVQYLEAPFLRQRHIFSTFSKLEFALKQLVCFDDT